MAATERSVVQREHPRHRAPGRGHRGAGCPLDAAGLGGNPSLTLMLWRLKTLWRLSGGVCRELAGDWYSMGLVSVGELAHRPSGTCGGGGQGGGGQAAGRHGHKTKPWGGAVSADRRTDGRTEQTTRGRAAFAPRCPHAHSRSRIRIFLPAQLFLALSAGLRPPALLLEPLPSPRRAPKIVALEGFTLMLQGPAPVPAEGLTSAPGQPHSAQVLPESSKPPLQTSAPPSRAPKLPFPAANASLPAPRDGKNTGRAGQGMAEPPSGAVSCWQGSWRPLSGGVGHLGAPKATSP